MKYLLLFLILFSFSCNKEPRTSETPKLQKETENTVGIGVLNISIGKEVTFYKDSSSNKPFDVLSFNKKRDGSYKFDSDYLESKMQAYRQFEGNTDKENEQMIRSGLGNIGPQLVFKVLDTTTNGYTILINEKTFETAFIKKEGPKFESWKEYLTRVEFITIEKPDLYNAPNGTIIPKSPLYPLNYYKVLDVKGEWAQITSRNEYNPTKSIKEANYTTAWIKWHDNQKLLIDITEYTLE
jgi:hypothetical protein